MRGFFFSNYALTEDLYPCSPKDLLLSILDNLMLSDMDNGHVTRTFFKNIANNWPIWADGLNKLGDIWGISS